MFISFQLRMSNPGKCPPRARRHSIASPGWMSSKPILRRSSITDSLSSLNKTLSGLALMQRRESRGSSGELGFEGVDKDFLQTILARHFDLDIRVCQVETFRLLVFY